MKKENKQDSKSKSILIINDTDKDSLLEKESLSQIDRRTSENKALKKILTELTKKQRKQK